MTKKKYDRKPRFQRLYAGLLGKALAAALAVAALQLTVCAATVTLAPPSGTSTNVLALYAGETSVEIAGPGTHLRCTGHGNQLALGAGVPPDDGKSRKTGLP